LKTNFAQRLSALHSGPSAVKADRAEANGPGFQLTIALSYLNAQFTKPNDDFPDTQEQLVSEIGLS
jgi:hypothetical protein